MPAFWLCSAGFPLAGPFSKSLGGGNGFVAAALKQRGVPVVLVEPGADGVRHARTRGLRNVVHATLKEARFRDRSLPAIGFFDVLEHIDDEHAFLHEIRRCLSPCGRIYLVVPAQTPNAMSPPRKEPLANSVSCRRLTWPIRLPARSSRTTRAFKMSENPGSNLNHP